MNLEHTLSTTRTVRKRMDLGRPVPHEVIVECLQLAVQAPTGGNRQGWQWVVVTDATKRRQIGEWYRESWYEYASAGRPSYSEDDPRRAQLPRVVTSARYLADHMGEVPVMVIPCHEGRVDRPGTSNRDIAGLYGSVLPAAWSFMLAARARGLGTAWTTLHLKYEREVADLLGIPYEGFTQTALITVGYITGEDLKPAVRIPLDQVVHWESW
ncbi:MAG TPA: nitroreductase family protein [Candidatus Dormibacteraeota bacterium]|nr:nitroreductase family protein [Candidatus Dormibacteraeota bacterium]